MIGFAHRIGVFAVLVAILCPVICNGADVGQDDAPRTIVLANSEVPESVSLAEYYMQARGIPAENLCLLALPKAEVLSRKLYDLQLRDPLMAFLREGGFIEQVPRDPDTIGPGEPAWTTVSSEVSYLVSMYGIPVRIADTRHRALRKVSRALSGGDSRDEAAVDSELAALLLPPSDLEGPRSNPLFAKYDLAESGSSGRLLLLATRLDGPDPGQLRAAIDHAIAAERYGLCGRAYFDVRGLKDPNYIAGDRWMQAAYARMQQEGYECVLETSPLVWGEAYPMEDVVFYLGWYAGQITGALRRRDFGLRPGAVAYHLHSASARELRTDEGYWAGPLMARGASATMGAVREPYLNFTPHLDIFTDRLCLGHTFAESAYMSLSTLSWQVTVVGDPLFRPFKYDLDTQVRHLQEDAHEDLEWAYIRQVNMLVMQGRFNIALEACRRMIDETGSLLLREKLGDLYARNELFKEAGTEYQYIVEHAETAETAVRVGRRWSVILRALGQVEEAETLEKGIRERWKGSTVLPWLETSE